ncbi:sulfotransferase family protein [Nodosilinea sp. AN01ver1]|uniref:sulfotransferase family protein n=1 Tax=Nodosilinea sp. AN01ver1 TaxID=3423362 RepID=UPI003D316AF3
MSDSTVKPIFIVGCPRSGTTLTRSILDAHPNIACGPETAFLKDLQRIVTGHWSRIEKYGFEKEYWNNKIADFFSTFKSEYAQSQNKSRWADKTPKYLYNLEFIYSLFPSMQIVHVVRDGHDVVLSHLDRWGYKRAIDATNDWPSCIKSARKFGKTLSSDQYFEIRYEDLVADPENSLKTLFDYLNEPWSPEILDKAGYSSEITERRRKEGDEKSLIYKSRVGVGKKKLDPILTALLNMRAGDLIRELGY